MTPVTKLLNNTLIKSLKIQIIKFDFHIETLLCTKKKNFAYNFLKNDTY